MRLFLIRLDRLGFERKLSSAALWQAVGFVLKFRG